MANFRLHLLYLFVSPVLLVKSLVSALLLRVCTVYLNLSSLLHYAAISGWEGTIALLLEHGVDPRQTCLTGEMALHFAVLLRHGKAAEALLKGCPDLVDEADKVS